MSRTRNLRWLVGGPLALLSACPGPKGNQNDTAISRPSLDEPRTPSGAIEIRVEKKTDSYAPWRIGEASLAIENRSEHPVIIHAASLESSGGTSIVKASTVERYPSQITVDAMTGAFADVLAIEGSLYEDMPGAMARLPYPPRWEWNGDGDLATFSVILPGATKAWSGTFRARYEVGDELRAKARYSVISDPEFRYYKKDKEELVDVGPKDPTFRGRGMTEVVRVKVTYKKKTGTPESAGEATPPNRPMPALFAPCEYALPAQAFDALHTGEAEASTPMRIDRFPFDIDAARTAANVTTGSYTRALEAKLWVLEAERATLLVSEAGLAKVRGNAIPLADALNRDRTRVVTLYRGDKPDPKGYLAHFQGKGFKAYEIREKDGSYTGRVPVEAARLVDFLQALDARGLGMKDDDEVE